MDILSSDTVEISYENTIEIPDDAWWSSKINTAHSNAKEDEALLAPTTTGFSCMPPLSNSIDHSQSPHPLSGLPFWKARRSHQAIQSPTHLLTTIDTPLSPQMSGASDLFSSATFDTTIPYHLLDAIGMESAGHESMPDNATLPEESYKVRCLLEQQPQAPVRAAETNSYEADHGDYFFGFEESSSQSSALPVNRAEYTTSENPVKPYFRAVEDHRYAQEWDAIHWGSNGKTSVEQPSSPSPVWRHKYPLKVPPAADPTSSHGLGQQGSPLGPSSLVSSTSSLPTNDNWSCATCGTLFTTKGTKNRNRNKRRHCCPGTGPKYPCPICPKSLNRGDSRLVHLRRWHPEMHTKPLRARKGKDLNEGSMN